MQRNIKLIVLLFAVGWMPVLAAAINFIYSHYTHNVLQTQIVHSFPFLDIGMDLLMISGVWIALVSFVVINYILGWYTTGKWWYPFNN